MAYPDYSVVIVSVTVNGVTTDYAQSFFNDELAKKYYKQSVSEGKRAFYYEKPRPTRFVRNDDQPLKANTEKGQENQTLQSVGSGQEVAGEDIEEDILKSAEAVFTDSMGAIKTIAKHNVLVAKKVWNVWFVGPFRFWKKVFNSIVNEPSDVVIGVDIITNKKITFKHDGNGGIKFEVEKLFPDKGEILLDDAINKFIEVTEFINPIAIGTEVKEKLFGGLSANDFTVRSIYTWIPAGVIVAENDTHILRSDGNGWVTMHIKEQTNPPPCPNVGSIAFESYVSDITSPVQFANGELSFVIVGYKYDVGVVNQNCDIDRSFDDRYIPAGTKVAEDYMWNYFSDGEGSTTSGLKEGDGGGGDNGGGDGGGEDPPPCPMQGEVLRTEVLNTDGDIGSYELNGYSGTYRRQTTTREWLANGYCDEIAGNDTTEYTPQGTFITTVPKDAGSEYELYVGPSGGWEYREVPIWTDNSDERDGDIADPEVPDIQYPEGPSSEPCPQRTQYPYGSISDFKLVSGWPTGGTTFVERNGVLPSGFFWRRDMSATTMKFKTGRKWFGRQLHDGQCGYYAEPENAGMYNYPVGTAKEAGYFSTNAQIVQNPYEWPISYTTGERKNGDIVWKTARCTVQHDGNQNITVNAWQT